MSKNVHANIPWLTHKPEKDTPQPITVNGKRINNYICLVDSYRRPSRKRNTAGRYRVGAKSETEAKRLLQAAIGFGSVMVYMVENEGLYSDVVPYKTCVKETYNMSTDRYDQTPAKHAIDRQS